jgi:UDP-galactose transporter B1
VQSFLASLIASVYLTLTTSHPHKPGRPAPIFPSSVITKNLFLIAVTSSLASPFGYASLKHIDYITFILAKSCKLLPVMALHITIFGKRYPVYKYAVVVLVTLGVSVFTLHAPSAAAKAAKHNSKLGGASEANKLYGLFLLGVNLLFDGLTNTVQDNIFQIYKPYGGAQMMCAMNIMATGLTSTYLLLAPYIASTPLGPHLGISGSELQAALAFIKAHPQVGYDVLGFSLCGALGQVAIYHTLSHFGSLVLVTVTVTRKMLTMVLSVLWFGHSISAMQWAGVGLVFGGIGGEAGMKYRETREKQRKAKDRALSEAGKDRKDAGLGKKD